MQRRTSRAQQGLSDGRQAFRYRRTLSGLIYAQCALARPRLVGARSPVRMVYDQRPKLRQDIGPGLLGTDDRVQLTLNHLGAGRLLLKLTHFAPGESRRCVSFRSRILQNLIRCDMHTKLCSFAMQHLLLQRNLAVRGVQRMLHVFWTVHAYNACKYGNESHRRYIHTPYTQHTVGVY